MAFFSKLFSRAIHALLRVRARLQSCRTSPPLFCHPERSEGPAFSSALRLTAARAPSAERKENLLFVFSDNRQPATDNYLVEAAWLHWPLKNSAQRGFEGAQLQLRRSKSFHICHPEEAFRPTRDLFLAFFSRLFSRAIHALLRVRARLPVVPQPRPLSSVIPSAARDLHFLLRCA